MKGRYRQQYQQREWMTRVDKGVLYQMEREAEHLQKLASEILDSRLQHIADRFTYLLAVANGKTASFDLSAERFSPAA